MGENSLIPPYWKGLLYARNWRGLPEANVYVGGSNKTAEGAALAVNALAHVAGIYDGTTIKLYLNGTLTTTINQTGAVATSSDALRIGGNTLWGEYCQGRIDEVRLYNRALTAS
jgi:Concanavalin A-like lectin/glucanases superfamily